MGTHLKDPVVWLRSLLASVIGGSCSAAASWLGMAAAKSAGVDVPALNFKALGIILISSGAMALFTYLAKSPLPEIVTTDTLIVKREEVAGQEPTVTTTQKSTTTKTDP